MAFLDYAGLAHFKEKADQAYLPKGDVNAVVSNWLSTNIPTGTTVAIDRSLTIANAAADSAVVGSKLTDLKSATDDNKQALTAAHQKFGDLQKQILTMDSGHKNLVHMLTDTIVDKSLVSIADKNGNHLVNDSGDSLSGFVYVVRTDFTGTKDHTPMEASMVGKTFLMSYDEMGIPVVYLEHPDILTLKKKADGDLSNVKIVCSALGIDTTLKKIKVQGSSSQAYEKKNYTLTFNNDVVIKSEWGRHRKYVIKADWVDFSHMRNALGAKIWGQIRKTRLNQTRAKLANENGDHLIDSRGNTLAGETDTFLSSSPNYCAIDAFPICVVINGTYWGLYSMTIPKDDWMAGMTGQNAHEGIVCAEDHGNPTRFKELVNYPDADGLMTGKTSGVKGFSMEYVPDEDDMDWLADSLNALIRTAMQSYSSDQAFLDALSPYLDIDSAVDYYIFNCLVDNSDATDKNFLLDTWDGQKWYFAAYDMDGTFGNEYHGKSYRPANSGVTFAGFRTINRIMEIIYDHNRTELIKRYNSLRKGVLSEANLMNLTMNYSVNIPKAAFDYEVLRWPGRPGTHTNDHHQIVNFLMLRCKYLDNEIAALSGAGT